MRSSSLFGPTSSLSRRLWVTLSTAAVLAGAVTFNSISQPSLNLNGLGEVGIAGDFDAISIYEYEGQTESSSFVNGSESLLAQLPNGIFTSLASADAGIQAMCVHELKNGTVRGIFIGGNFTSLGNVPVNGVALYNPDDKKVTALNGLIGKVQALLCDKETNTVYVGGDFMGSNSSNAIAWVDGKGWSDLPFDGFDQPVNTIAKSPNNTIVFGGDFNFLVNASSPLVRHAQTVNLVSTDITAEQTTDRAGFNDPTSIVCSTAEEKQWLLRDGQVGSWTAKFKFGFKPTKLRLRNANFEGRGTKLFRFTALPINGIMNLTYSDPVTNSTKNCDAWCPLSDTADYQDFLFVNEVGMSSIRIDILGYYGAGGGLAGIELFQDDIFSFAVPALNEPSCAATTVRSNSIVTGQWTETQGPEVDSQYLSADVSTSQLSTASVVFEPHIQQSGEYVVLVFTPGCRQDNTCSFRGQVNITGTYTKSGPPPISTQFFQTNDFDKYDTVYRGFVDAADDTFRPRVTLTPTSSQSFSFVNIVAQKVQFQMYSNMTNGTSEEGSPELNGLYEYDPNQTEAPKPSDIANSVISTAGGRLRASAKVKAVTAKNDMTYVAGDFFAKDGSFQHFFAIGSGGVVTVTKGGLDAPVNAMLLQDDLLYLGGQFQDTNSSSTSGLGFVAAYNTASKDWESLGAGVDGRVKKLVPLTLNLTRGTRTAIAVSGDFTTIRAAGTTNSSAVNVKGFAVWIPSEKEWLERMSNETIFLRGTLSASVSVPGSGFLYAGSIASQTDSAPGAVSLKSGNRLDVQTFPVTMVNNTVTNNSQPNRKRKRTLAPSGFQGVVTGAYYIANGKNLAILGGHFEAQGSGGTVNNLLIIDNSSQGTPVTGVGSELDTSSTVLSLLVVDSLLFIGGSIKGRIGDADIVGLAVWDFSKMAFVNKQQPVGLQGSNVEVRAITRRPSRKNEIYVAGQFDSAGSLSCPSLCIFDNNATQWLAPRGDISGQINVLYWVDANNLLAGGNMTLNNTATYLAIYNAKSSTWGAFDGDISNIPGPVTSIAVNSDTIDSIFVSGAANDSGAAYVMKLKSNGKFEALSGLGNNTTVRNIQVLELQNHGNSNDFLQDKQTLLAMGSLSLPNFGNASAATFDGSSWKPLLLTSTANNEPGTIVSLFSQKQQKFSSKGRKLATGFVILISLAIALGLVFLLVVLGVLASYIRRQREGYSPMPTSPSPVRPSTDMQERIPPSSLFGNMRLDPGRKAPIL